MPWQSTNAVCGALLKPKCRASLMETHYQREEIQQKKYKGHDRK